MEKCYRATAFPSLVNQSWFSESPRVGDECAEFIEVIEAQLNEQENGA